MNWKEQADGENNCGILCTSIWRGKWVILEKEDLQENEEQAIKKMSNYLIKISSAFSISFLTNMNDMKGRGCQEPSIIEGIVTRHHAKGKALHSHSSW